MALFSHQEHENLRLVEEYMQISYDPKRASAKAVAHLCAQNNRFIAPTTFPEVKTLEQYAEDHGKLMKQIADLHLVSFDAIFAKDDLVCIRYTAEGSHCGEAHGSIAASGKKARWTAAGIFRCQDGKSYEKKKAA